MHSVITCFAMFFLSTFTRRVIFEKLHALKRMGMVDEVSKTSGGPYKYPFSCIMEYAKSPQETTSGNASLYFWGYKGAILVDIRTTSGIEIAEKVHFSDPDLLHEEQASKAHDLEKLQNSTSTFPDEDTWRAYQNTYHSFRDSACKFVSDAVEGTVRGAVEKTKSDAVEKNSREEVNPEHAGVPITCDIQCGDGSTKDLHRSFEAATTEGAKVVATVEAAAIA